MMLRADWKPSRATEHDVGRIVAVYDGHEVTEG